MTATNHCHLVSFGAVALCTVITPTIGAQVPPVAASGAVSAATADTVQPEGSAAPPGNLRGPEDSTDSERWLRRYRPKPGLAGIGVFAGAVVISDDIGVRAPATFYSNTPAEDIPYTTLKKPSFQLGARGGYYPLSFLGGEIEGMLTAAQSDLEEQATILGGRAQAVVQLPYWSLVPFVVGGVGYWDVLDDEAADASDLAIHYGVGAKANVTRKVDLRIDLRDSIAGNGSPHHIELLAGAGLVFGREAPVAVDTDHDGLFDDRDQCPLAPGLPVDEGCPARIATSGDTDSDGIADGTDQCSTEAGIAPTGCPILDADRDGVADGLDRCASEKGVPPTGCPDTDLDSFLDADDKCPSAAGVAPDGCPADVDGDGIAGAADRCPLQRETKNGIEDSDGCPDQLPPEVKSLMGVVAGIEFERKKADLSPVSEVVLENAATILKQYPSLRVEIVGHTDARGERQMNIDLSLQRAMSQRKPSAPRHRPRSPRNSRRRARRADHRERDCRRSSEEPADRVPLD